MAESGQISWAYVKLENIAEIYSAWIDSKIHLQEKSAIVCQYSGTLGRKLLVTL